MKKIILLLLVLASCKENSSKSIGPSFNTKNIPTAFEQLISLLKDQRVALKINFDKVFCTETYISDGPYHSSPDTTIKEVEKGIGFSFILDKDSTIITGKSLEQTKGSNRIKIREVTDSTLNISLIYDSESSVSDDMRSKTHYWRLYRKTDYSISIAEVEMDFNTQFRDILLQYHIESVNYNYRYSYYEQTSYASGGSSTNIISNNYDAQSMRFSIKKIDY